MSEHRYQYAEIMLDRFGDESMDIINAVLDETRVSHASISEVMDEILASVALRITEHVMCETIQEMKVLNAQSEEKLMEMVTEYSDLEEFVANLPDSVKNYNKLEKL